MDHIKFPSIEQFRHVIKNVSFRSSYISADENGQQIFNKNVKWPILKFRGTEKLHGTNAGIVYDLKTDTIVFQSRERILSLDQDNAGFMAFMLEKQSVLKKMLSEIVDIIGKNLDKIVMYGEWCGGSIQKGIALNQLEKMFVIFSIKAISESEETWVDLEKVKHIFSEEDRIFNILNFKTWEIDIDFSSPQIAQNELVNITNLVENESPIGKSFGVSGIGEGVVYTCITPGWESSNYWFKVKGEKHSVSKVKTLASVDIEMMNSVNEFIDSVVTENRLTQMLDNLINEKKLEFEMTSIKTFLSLVHSDIIKEEQDTIGENNFDQKIVNRKISEKAREWFIEKLNIL